MSTIVVLVITLTELESAVTEHLIKSKDREFQFQGELIAQQEETADLANGQSCQIDAKTYAIENGGYVAVLEFLRSDRPDAPVVLFEEIDVTDDVEKFFYVFEPSEVFCEKASTPEQLQDIEQNCKTLGRLYEKMIFAFLDEFQSETAARGTKDKPKPPKKEGSIWRTLGMG